MKNIICGLEITTDNKINEVCIDVNNIKSIQNIVGGYFEAAYLKRLKAVMWINEEGKLHELPINELATFLYKYEYAIYEYVNRTDIIVGNVLITGIEDEEGNLTGLNKEQINKINHLLG